MTGIPPSAETAARRNRRLLFAGLIAVIVVIIAALAYQLPKSASSASSSPSAFVSHSSAESPLGIPPGGHKRTDRTDRTDRTGSRGEADGALPDGVTVFDDRYPGIAGLDPDLLQALRDAAIDAADDGVELNVNSGRRSLAYQDRLFREAVAKYGSEDEAARWVAPGATSPHVSGNAVDIGPSDAVAWLSDHGVRYGLCRIYRNEPWHFELRAHAVVGGCPPMYADPTEDPRIRQ